MKKTFTLLAFFVLTLSLSAQIPVELTFEEGMADTSWIPFANGTQIDGEEQLSVVANPLQVDPNASDSVLQFIIHDDADKWVGIYSDHAGYMIFDADNHSISMVVYKSVVSPVRVKLERSDTGGDDFSLDVSNSLTDEWELLTWDLSAVISHYYQRLTIFPDYIDRGGVGSTVYIDNIASPNSELAVKKFATGTLKVFPNPVENRMAVQYPGMKGMKIMDLLGKTIETFTFSTRDSKVVDLSSLAKGMYFVSVETDNGSYSVQFIKK